MPGFYYLLREILPEELVERHAVKRQVLRRFGLADVLSDVTHCSDDVMTSCKYADQHSDVPVGGTVILPKTAAGTDPRSWGFHGTTQTWQPVELQPGAPTMLWIGWETDNPPTPVDLLRKTAVPRGRYLLDQLDQQWLFPVAHSKQGRATLPASLVRTVDGVKHHVAKPYQSLWELSGQIRDWYRDDFHVDPDDVLCWKYDCALQILQTNYRIGVHELNALDAMGRPLLTTENLDPLLASFIDWDLPDELMEIVEKKTETAAG
jgi:hypothetical protein